MSLTRLLAGTAGVSALVVLLCLSNPGVSGSRNLYEGIPWAANDAYYQDGIGGGDGWLVWTDNRDYPGSVSAENDVYGFDTATETVRRLTTSLSEKHEPEADDGFIVWSVNDRPNDQMDLYGLDVATDETFTIASGPHNESAPDIEYPWVVYQSDEEGWKKMDIWAYNIETQERRQLSPGPGRQVLPQIGGDLVAWIEMADLPYEYFISGAYGHVVVHDLTTGESRTPAPAASQQSEIHVDAPLVVWQEVTTGSTDTDIYVYDWDKGTTQLLVSGPGNQVVPRLHYPNLIWFDATDPDDPNKLLYYDLVQRSEPVRLGGPSYDLMEAAIEGEFAGWLLLRPDGGGGSTDVWGAQVRYVATNPAATSSPLDGTNSPGAGSTPTQNVPKVPDEPLEIAAPGSRESSGLPHLSAPLVVLGAAFAVGAAGRRLRQP